MRKIWTEECFVLTIRECLLHYPKIKEYPYSRINVSDDTDSSKTQSIGFTKTFTQFNGTRIWFLCPLCGKRAMKLFSPLGNGVFGCRKCHRLDYKLHFFGRYKRYPMIKFKDIKKKLWEARLGSNKFRRRAKAYRTWEEKYNAYVIEVCRRV